MKNFTYNENFFNSIEELLDYESWDEETINSFEDDWSIECRETEERPVCRFDDEMLFDFIEEDRHPEDWDEHWEEKVRKAIRENIDFDRLNNSLPKLWYETGKEFTITKQDLINELK